MFVLALIPAVVFGVFDDNCCNLQRCKRSIILCFFEFRCNPAGSLFIALIVMFLQTAGIINYINTYKEVREYKESHTDDEDYESIL
ncbi:MAG: hypothetical protein NC177_01970 [Ruminococcus flavefaciens]|nr:hypothetical protein [Ruminococcus flavefaciens]